MKDESGREEEDEAAAAAGGRGGGVWCRQSRFWLPCCWQEKHLNLAAEIFTFPSGLKLVAQKQAKISERQNIKRMFSLTSSVILLLKHVFHVKYSSRGLLKMVHFLLFIASGSKTGCFPLVLPDPSHTIRIPSKS